jgi:hypothetical protein
MGRSGTEDLKLFLIGKIALSALRPDYPTHFTDKKTEAGLGPGQVPRGQYDFHYSKSSAGLSRADPEYSG